MDLKEFLILFKETVTETRLSFDLKAVYSNRLLQIIGIGLFGLFLPIFLFEEFNHSVQNVLIFYILGYGLVFLLAPLGAIEMSRIGLKRSMLWGTFFLAAHCLCFYFLETNVFFFLGLALLSITLFRILYWVPYHTHFALSTLSGYRGRQIAFLSSITFLAGAITPVSAGFIIERFGFSFLFLIAMVIIGIAVLPLFPIKQVYEKYSYSYFQTFKELFKNRKLLIGYGGEGAQGAVGMVIWPIFIYQLLNEQYIVVGAISSAVILFTIIFHWIVGDITDIFSKRKLMKTGTVLFALGWIVKIFIQTSFQIFIVSVYHSFTGIIRGTPFSAFMYEEMADQGHYIDEYTVLREISMNIGRVLMLVACFILLTFAGIAWTFLLAAIASLFINVL